MNIISQKNLETTGCSQKSFYGKAKLEVWVSSPEVTVTACRSYNTIVAVAVRHDDTTEIFNTWDGYSVTTANHLKAFCYQHEVEFNGKKAWQKKPVVDVADVLDYASGINRKIA